MGSSFSMIGGGTSPEDTCVICTESGADQDTGVEQVQICPNGHYAHVDCITPWYVRSDTCPECRVDVQNFPLWRDINPAPAPAPVRVIPRVNILRDFDNNEYDDDSQEDERDYDFNNIETRTNAKRRFDQMREQNDYDLALDYFDSDEGSAYLQYLLNQDAAKLDEFINVDGEDPENILYHSLIYNIVVERAFEVAEALVDYARGRYNLVGMSGPVINLFYDSVEEYRDIVDWLFMHGFRPGFWFLVNTSNIESFNWYLDNIRPRRDDPRMLELYNDKVADLEEGYGVDPTVEEDPIYEVLNEYMFNQGDTDLQQQGGGMWQRGGFFMTCS